MVDLFAARIEEKPVLARLIELYEHDMSEFTGDDVGSDGCFGYRYLDFYWTETHRKPFLLKTEGQVCGFVLVRLDVQSALAPESTAHNIAEFFIMRKYRRRGIGQQAATLAFDRFRGSWEVFQVAGHSTAQQFWRKVIGAYTGGSYEEGFLDNAAWHGTVQRFSNATA